MFYNIHYKKKNALYIFLIFANVNFGKSKAFVKRLL